MALTSAGSVLGALVSRMRAQVVRSLAAVCPDRRISRRSAGVTLPAAGALCGHLTVRAAVRRIFKEVYSPPDLTVRVLISTYTSRL